MKMRHRIDRLEKSHGVASRKYIVYVRKCRISFCVHFPSIRIRFGEAESFRQQEEPLKYPNPKVGYFLQFLEDSCIQ